MIIVETANRFARDLIAQETSWRFLQGLGVTLGAVEQFEKAALVALARKFARYPIHKRKRSLRDISAELIRLDT